MTALGPGGITRESAKRNATVERCAFQPLWMNPPDPDTRGTEHRVDRTPERLREGRRIWLFADTLSGRRKGLGDRANPMVVA